MAKRNQPDSLSQVKAKSLECAICFQRFKDPRIFKQCLHTFCSRCLVKLAHGNPTMTIKCPICQEVIPVPEKGAEYFPPNFQLREIVEEAALHDSLLQNVVVMCNCHQGEDEQEAVARCFECNEYLCISGLDAHKRFKPLDTHPVASLEDLRSNNVRPKALGIPKQIKCKRHSEDEAKYFCEPCDEPLCHTCYNLHHSDRRRHYCKDIKDAVPHLRKVVDELATRLDAIATDYERAKERTERTAQTIREQGARKKDLISTRINETKLRLHQQVDQVVINETQPLRQLSANLGRTAEQTRNAHAQAVRLEKADDGEFMQMYDIMMGKITQLTRLRRPPDRKARDTEWPEWTDDQRPCCLL